jgi:hypothetical protein
VVQGNERPPGGSARRALARLGVTLGSVLLALLLLEAGQRGWQRARGRPYDRAALERDLRVNMDPTAFFVPGADAEGEALGLGILNPYSGGEKYPDTGGVLQAFRQGFAPEEYTVVVLGGSVAANWAEDIDAIFRRRLEADPRLAGKRVRVLSYAHGAYKQPQQVMRLAYLLSFGYRPDAVVSLDGFNEVADGWENVARGTHPLYPAPAVWAGILHARRDPGPEALEALAEMWDVSRSLTELAETALSSGLTRSSLLGTWIRARMERLRARRVDLQARFIHADGGRVTVDEGFRRQRFGPVWEGRIEATVELCARAWFESALSLHELCAARGIHYVHCLQPTLLDPGSKPRSAEEQVLPSSAPGWEPGVVRGYPLLREHGRELAARGVRFADVSRTFEGVTETLYFDECHFLAPGNRLLSEAIADAFLAGLPDPPR